MSKVAVLDHVKVKRNSSTVFITIGKSKLTCLEVKQELLLALQHIPDSDAPKTIEEIELGYYEVAETRPNSAPALPTPEAETIKTLNDDDLVNEELLVWRIKGEEYNVNAYPEEEE